ncbi:GrpB family protein [Alicyclobacillus sp. SP_1]|uniref:GrpB family protein n=1 Tax=Alicyclobacillus sp. SP_1 TaxID=2942475 RepID=UPI0035BE8CE1
MTAVVLKDYDPLWMSQFEADRKLISCAPGERLRRIEHVGSTSGRISFSSVTI